MKRVAFLILILSLAVVCRGEQPSSAPVLKTATSVSAQYYLSLPEAWKADGEWPILVTVDGSGHDFLGNCQGFIHAREKRTFIIVTPCISSNGQDPAEVLAVLAIVQEVQKKWHGHAKFFITGFSAGGHTAWKIIFGHPELLAGAAPAAANYLGRGVRDISTAPERAQLPVRAFQGGRDPYLASLDEQWKRAQDQATSSGFQTVTRTMVPEAGHVPFFSEVIAFFTTLLPRS